MNPSFADQTQQEHSHFLFVPAKGTDLAVRLCFTVRFTTASMASSAEEKTGVYANTAAIKQNMTSGGNLAFHNFNNDFAHISNANERRRLALAEIDKAPFGWCHVRAIAVAGVGDRNHDNYGCGE